MTELGRTDFLILSALSQSQATSQFTAMTIKELIECGIGIKRTTVHKYLHRLMEYEYVEVAGKAAKENTYCLTNKGKNFLKEMCELC